MLKCIKIYFGDKHMQVVSPQEAVRHLLWYRYSCRWRFCDTKTICCSQLQRMWFWPWRPHTLSYSVSSNGSVLIEYSFANYSKEVATKENFCLPSSLKKAINSSTFPFLVDIVRLNGLGGYPHVSQTLAQPLKSTNAPHFNSLINFLFFNEETDTTIENLLTLPSNSHFLLAI